MVEMAYIDNEEACVVVTKDFTWDDAVKKAEGFLKGYASGACIVTNPAEPKQSYVHRVAEHCKHEGWEWALDRYTVSNEPVWTIDVHTKEEE